MPRPITADEFEELYRSTAAELLAYIRRRTSGDAEDLAAEVYAIAWRRRTELPPAFLRRAWLFGAARRLILSDLRRRDREQESTEQVAALGWATTADADDQLGAAVTAALGRLTPEAREVILLVEWERLTPGELAVVLGVRPGSARMRLHRARQALAADPELRLLVPAVTPMRSVTGRGRS
ncbi:MAG: RNA polymerase sigma factor [Nocardioidaceae bacterium]